MSAFLLANAAGSALLAGLAWVLGRTRIAPRWMHALWLLVLVKLLAPPLVEVRWIGDLVPPLAAAEPRAEGVSIAELGLALWGLGAVAMLLGSAHRAHRLRRLVERGRAAPADLLAQVRGVAATLRLARVPRVLLVDSAVSPCVAGVGARTTLLLPAALLAPLGPDRLRMVLAHELAHVARRDPWVRVIELVTGALFWWDPLAHLARRELRRWEELACDAHVLAHWPGESRAYASALVETVAHLARPAARMATALAEGDVAARVRGILSGPRATRSSVASGAALALFTLLLPLAPASARPLGGSWTVHATDPGGAFEVEFLGESVTGVVLDGARLAQGEWLQDDGFLRVRPQRADSFDVRLLTGRRIAWEARPTRAME